MKREMVKAAKFVKDHRDVLLTAGAALGVVGLFGTTVVGTVKSVRAIDVYCYKHNYAHPRDIPKKVMFQLVWKHYIGSAVSGAAALGCIFGNAYLNDQHKKVLVAAAVLSDKRLDAYTKEVEKVLTPEQSQAIKEKVETEVPRKPQKQDILFIEGQVRCKELNTGREFYSTPTKIREVMNTINHKMMRENYVTLNDIFYELGLELVKEDRTFESEHGLIEVDFEPILGEGDIPMLGITIGK